MSLVKKVCTAIAIEAWGKDWILDELSYPGEDVKVFGKQAEAAIRVVIEEAAKIAERTASPATVAAIRALAKEPVG